MFQWPAYCPFSCPNLIPCASETLLPIPCFCDSTAQLAPPPLELLSILHLSAPCPVGASAERSVTRGIHMSPSSRPSRAKAPPSPSPTLHVEHHRVGRSRYFSGIVVLCIELMISRKARRCSNGSIRKNAIRAHSASSRRRLASPSSGSESCGSGTPSQDSRFEPGRRHQTGIISS